MRFVPAAAAGAQAVGQIVTQFGSRATFAAAQCHRISGYRRLVITCQCRRRVESYLRATLPVSHADQIRSAQSSDWLEQSGSAAAIWLPATAAKAACK